MFFFIKKIKTMMAILMEILFSVLVLCATVCAVEQDWHFSGLNVALGKRAIQTPFTHGYQNAPLAVDGNIPNLSQNDSCAQATVPLKKQYAIWEVDLESTYNISGIKIYYRENTSLERLSRLTILTFYNTWESVSKDNFLRCPDYHDQEIKPLVCQDIINVVLHPPVLSNHVRLKMNNSLTLCEVEIISVACKRPNVPNGGTNAEAKTLNGISINLKCDEGFFTNESTSMCTAQGTWNPQPRCAKGCKEPTLSNGKYAYTNSERLVIGSVGRLWFGSVINPHCYDGYHLQPNGSRRCLTNEEWSGDIPECKPVTCQERPESFSHGYFTPEQNPPFKHGFTFVPKCETGFKLSYGVNRTCSHVNYWTGNNARCETISCELTMLENGFYTLGSQKTTSNVISVGLSISPSCNDGYHLSNSNNRTCKENGEISGDSPLCKKVQCDSFGPLPNGNMWFKNNTLTIHNAFDYGTTILSECDKGFELRGSVEHRCLKNGSWSGITPICEKIRCTNQTILKDLYQQNTKELLFGDEFIADYNSEHFYLVNGSLDVECAADGSLRWATPQPILASICKVQKNDNFRADTRHCLVDDKCEVGKTITFECREDYQMLQITATCLRNHTWSSRPICTPLSQPTSNGAIIGVSVAVGVAVIAIVIAVLLFLHRRKLRKSKPKTHYEKADELKEQLNVYSEISETHKTDRKKVEDTEECAFASNTRVVVEDKETLNPRYQSCYSVESSKKMPITAIRVDDLYDVVLGSEHGVTMKKQFQDFPKGLKKDYSAALQIQNRPKNRYKQIYPYNDTRVILPMDERHPDYINASYIYGYNKTRAFIASQGPTDDMLMDFWRMVWYLDCGKIVMLTNLEEDKTMKCVQYWPDEGCKEYEDFLITNRGTEYFSDFIIRKLSIQKTHGEERKLIHFHFTAWPDKSVPKYSSSLVHFRHKVETTIVNENGPVIVHCSAGIGRTGTFIALNVLSEQAATEGYVDPVGCVSNLREQRVNMVQTAEQYIFLHMTLLETLMLSTSALPSSRFLGAYEELLAFDKTQRTRKIDVEFSRMEKMSPVADVCQYVRAKELRNRNKNRYSNILPDADHMPYLTPSGKRSEPDYINAVFLPGYKKKRAFIVTQTPLEATKTDFWRLVVEHDVHTIVMMNNKSEMKEDEIYWPENEEKYEIMTITKTGLECEKGLRKMTFDLKRFGQTRKLQQIQFEGWPDDSALPSSPKDVINLLDAVQFWQQQSGNNPVLVHCMNGADRSGLYCVASTVLERMKIEQDVAIAQVIKEMRNYREQIIPSVDQFQFVHEVVKEYILQNETYSNFTY